MEFDEIKYREAAAAGAIQSVVPTVWTQYEFEVLASRPPCYGRFFVLRKDGKVHWETWNGTSWAYNEATIVAWADIGIPRHFLPIKKAAE